MRRLRKLVNVLLVIGAAALMSVPFKRVPPQNTKKNAGRGEWQLVKPDIPFRDLIKSGDSPSGTPGGKPGSQAAKKGGKTVPRGGNGSSGATRPIVPDPGDGTNSTPRTAVVPTPSVSYSRPATANSTSNTNTNTNTTTFPEPLSDREAMKRARVLRIPRIAPLPEPSERLDDGSGLPNLPSEFTPL